MPETTIYEALADQKSLVEHVARAIAAADQEDYMEDWVRYDRRAIAAIKAYQELLP